MKHIVLLLAIASSLTASAAPRGSGGVFSDDFESGNLLAWDVISPPLPTPTVFRTGVLLLRDPHVFVPLPLFGCFDFTDTAFPLGLGPSFNQQLAAAVTTDSDGDGLLDSSQLVGFRPLDELAAAGAVDAGGGDCLAPLAGTVCDWRLPPVPRRNSYQGLAAGECLAAAPGTTSGYNPPVPSPDAPCFVTAAQDLAVDFGGVPVTLVQAQTAARFVGSPPTAVNGGLQRGFLSEASANLILLPAEVPIVGGQPLSVLLRGGAGNCAAGDDRDVVNGVTGWWFYFEVAAEPVGFVGN